MLLRSLCLAASLFAATAGFAQTLNLSFDQGDDPNKVVAMVDGKKFTLADLRALTVVMDPKMVETVKSDPVHILRMYAFMKRLSEMAEKEGIPNKTPYKEKIEVTRMNLLANSMLDYHVTNSIVMPEDQKKHYEATKDNYRIAQLKMIYLPYSNATEEAAALAKAKKIVEEAKGGADFVKLVKENSKHGESLEKDGDFGPIKATENLPPAIKTAIFKLKDGEISEPVLHTNGYYIFKLISMTVEPYEKVRDAIYNELKDQEKQAWQKSILDSIDIKIIEDKPAAKPEAAAPASKAPKK